MFSSLSIGGGNRRGNPQAAQRIANHRATSRGTISRMGRAAAQAPDEMIRRQADQCDLHAGIFPG